MYKALVAHLFYQLCSTGQNPPSHSTDAANKLAVSFILVRLDYCNSSPDDLPYNKLNQLQLTQNHAARFVHKPRHESATSLLRTRLRLGRVQYKIACLCFQCVCHDNRPPYLSDILRPYHVPRTLCFLDTSLLTVLRFSPETFGESPFFLLAPLPAAPYLYHSEKNKSFSTFKRT